MTRTRFNVLLHKYQKGTTTSAECRVVEQWYALLEEEPRPLNDREWKELERRLWIALKQKALGKITPVEVEGVSLWRRPLFKLGIVASVCPLFVFGYGIYRFERPDSLSNW